MLFLQCCLPIYPLSLPSPQSTRSLAFHEHSVVPIWVQYVHAQQHLQGGPKSEAINSWLLFCQIVTDLQNIFTGRLRLLGKFALHWLLKIPPLLAYVTTLPCETLMFIDKLQGSVTTYLRCGADFNNQIKKGLLMNLSVKIIKLVNIWQRYQQERGCLVHFLRFSAVWWPSAHSARDNLLLVWKNSLTDLAINLC